MSALASSLVSTPDHIAQELVVDFDVYAPSVDASDFLEAGVVFQARTAHRVVWSPHHGGHWVPTRGQDVFDIHADHERFSSKYFCIPALDNQGQLGAFTLDPPEHEPFRRFLNKGMTPNVVACWRRPQIEPPCRRRVEPDNMARRSGVTRLVR